MRCYRNVTMESHERQLYEDSKAESVEAKAELANGSEKAVASTRTKPNRARLLRRCTSQCLLLNDNQKDLNKIQQFRRARVVCCLQDTCQVPLSN